MEEGSMFIYIYGNGVKCHPLDHVLCSITGMGWTSLENVLTQKLVSYTFHVCNSQHMKQLLYDSLRGFSFRFFYIGTH
jgi:hypothetical protein